MVELGLSVPGGSRFAFEAGLRGLPSTLTAFGGVRVDLLQASLQPYVRGGLQAGKAGNGQKLEGCRYG